MAIAGDREIFCAKALIFAERIRSRDVFDVWWLMTHTAFGMDDFRAAFEAVGQPGNFETALARILRQPYGPADPGYTVIAQGAPNRDEARSLLVAIVEDWLRTTASTRFAERLNNPPGRA